MMEGKEQQVPGKLEELMVLRILGSRFPEMMESNELEKEMVAKNCSTRKLAEILPYLKEKRFVEGRRIFGGKWLFLKITDTGIDRLRELPEKIKMELDWWEEKQR